MPVPVGATPVKRLWLICLALALLTAVVYLPVIRFDFVDHDDSQYIRDNRNVSSGLSGTAAAWAFTTPHLNYWQPLTWISHMLDCELFGLNPRPHHAVNLLFHVANVLLLFLLMFRATGSPGRSACLAALFAVHPLNVETVAWLAERKGLLSTFFCFLSILAYINHARNGSWRAYLLSAFLFALACMSKPMVVTLPFLLLLLDIWPLGRFRAGDRRARRRIIVEKIPLFALSAFASAITVWASRQAGTYVNLDALPLSARVAKVPVAYAQYLSKTFWPQDLTILYPIPPHWAASTLVLSTLVIVAITCFALAQFRQRTYLAVGWLWFLGTLVPGLGLVAAGSQQLIADRFAYIPIVGIFIMVVWGVPDLVARLRPKSPAGVPLKVIAITAVLVCACLSSVQLPVWRDRVALWAHAIRVNKDNPDNNSVTLHEIGVGLLTQGSLMGATNYFARALAITPDFPRVRAQYARALLLLTNYPDAIQHAGEAVRGEPREPIAHHVLGTAYLGTNGIDAALPHLNASLQLGREFLVEHGDLVAALLAGGRSEEAIAFLENGISIDPHSARAHFQIAAARAARRQFRESIEHYREGLRLRPNTPVALNNLAWILATHPDAALRNGKDAVRFAEKGCALSHRQVPLFLGTLAAAYAEAGDFDKAIQTAQEARDLARGNGESDLAARNEQLLAHYQSRNPWREPP
jgi:protein O-mannosyl-transferase